MDTAEAATKLHTLELRVQALELRIQAAHGSHWSPQKRRKWLLGSGGALAAGTTLLGWLFSPGGCSPSDIQKKVARMTIISPEPAEVAVIREMAHKYYTCPAGSVTIYVIARVEHTTNVTQVGIRCQ